MVKGLPFFCSWCRSVATKLGTKYRMSSLLMSFFLVQRHKADQPAQPFRAVWSSRKLDIVQFCSVKLHHLQAVPLNSFFHEVRFLERFGISSFDFSILGSQTRNDLVSAGAEKVIVAIWSGTTSLTYMWCPPIGWSFIPK
jgi:hypothetical protein